MRRRAELDRDAPQSHDEYVGHIYYLKKDFAKADAILTRIYAGSFPIGVANIRTFAGTKVGLGQYPAATELYIAGLKRFPKSCDLWNDFGQMYVEKGDGAAAMSTFDSGVQAVPKCGLSYNSAARLLIKQNRIPEAKQILNALIKTAPKSDGAVIAKEIMATL